MNNDAKNNRLIDAKVAEYVMGLDLKPHPDRAKIKVGYSKISMTGPVFELRDGTKISMPGYKSLPMPKCPHDNINDYYALHIANVLGDKIKDEVESARDEPKPYSTSISAAWEVVERVDYFTIDRSVDCKMAYQVKIGQLYEAKADTAPMAICLAALKAKGVEV